MSFFNRRGNQDNPSKKKQGGFLLVVLGSIMDKNVLKFTNIDPNKADKI